MIDPIKSTQSEYEPTVYTCRTNDQIDWDQLTCLLMKDHDWTHQGAAAIVALTQQYGSFILANAYALALATNTQDGDSGL